MFLISETEGAAIRTAFKRGGENAAAAELRRLFAGLPDNEATRMSAVAIATRTWAYRRERRATVGGCQTYRQPFLGNPGP